MVRRGEAPIAVRHRGDGRGRYGAADAGSGRKRVILFSAVGLVGLLLVAVAWVGIRGLIAKGELEAAIPLADKVKEELLANEPEQAAQRLEELQSHTDAAVGLTGDPVWRLAEAFPVLGSNLIAFRVAAEVVGTVTSEALDPVVELAGTIDISSFKPVNGQVNLDPIIEATASVELADDIVREQLQKALGIDVSQTVQPVDDAVKRLQDTLADASETLASVRTAVNLLPGMLGADGPRNYLLIFQNNAETRALGGNPASLALVHVDDGKVDLAQQASSGDLADGVPALALDPATMAIYEADVTPGSLTGYIQNITMFPDYPTVAQLAQAMWERKFGTKVDGVISIDPVALSYLIGATDDVIMPNGDVLTQDNVVAVLLADTYARFPDPADQDRYFADAAKAVFELVKSGAGESKALVEAMAKGVAEGRIIVWSNTPAEQEVIETTDFSGILPTVNDQKTVVGVYFNDFSTSKLNYYMSAVVEVDAPVCAPDGFTTTAKVTLTSSVPDPAGLPSYVTGLSPDGVIKIDTVVIGPVGAAYESTDGRLVVQGVDKGRPVARVAMTLAPGETKTVTVTMTSPAGAYGPLQVRTTPLVGATEVVLSDHCG